MKDIFKLVIGTIFIGQLTACSNGTRKDDLDSGDILKIDSIAQSIDQNEKLGESIAEGDAWAIYYLYDDSTRITYRVRHTDLRESYMEKVFYYHNKLLIKATVSWIDTTKLPSVYYFDNNRLIRAIDVVASDSNRAELLKEGLSYGTQYK